MSFLIRAIRCTSISRPALSRRLFSSVKTSYVQRSSRQRLVWGTVIGAATCLALVPQVVHLDSAVSSSLATSDEAGEESFVDPATSIAFPETLRVPSRANIPAVTLVGVGVRTVSFLGIKVYSVAFYADLKNPILKVPKELPVDEKIGHIIRNTTCVIRIVPTRSTNYTHLRDAFMRALQSRMTLAKQQGTLTEEEAQAAGSPMRKLKSLFPNSALSKHTPFDVVLTPPNPGHPRALIFRDLGSIENDWVSTELMLHYFEGDGVSPPLKKMVCKRLENFTT